MSASTQTGVRLRWFGGHRGSQYWQPHAWRQPAQQQPRLARALRTPRRRPPSPAPRSDPSPTAGRGADVPFVEQEAENAVTDVDRHRPEHAGVHAGSRGLRADLPSASRARTVCPVHAALAANAMNVRYSIRRFCHRWRASLLLFDVNVNGDFHRTMKLTSQYSWLYGQYPFDNDPTGGRQHSYRLCGGVPVRSSPDLFRSRCSRRRGARITSTTSSRPLGRTFPAGSTIRLPLRRSGLTPRSRPSALLDSQLVGPPKVVFPAVNVLLFGADPTGHRDASQAYRTRGHRASPRRFILARLRPTGCLLG